MEIEIVLPTLRPQQREMWDKMKRFNAFICHRRFGKSVFAILRLIHDAINNKREFPKPQYFYIGPTYKQTKRIAWNYIVHYCSKIPGATINRSDLLVTFEEGQSIRLLGAEDYDSLRGIYADGIILDEAAMVPTEAWHEVLRPMLTDFRGYIVFCGTPKGMFNLLHDMYVHSKNTPHWQWCNYKVSDTQLISPEELEDIRQGTPPAIFAQEYENSFEGALVGAYYATEMHQMAADGRIISIQYDKTRPVYASVDIGYGDLMVYVIFQVEANGIDILDCQVFNQMSIPDQHVELSQLVWKPTTLLLPHDANQHEVGSGKTRKQVWHSLGYDCTVVPKHAVADGIEMVRDMLPRVRMNQDTCETLVQAMLQYHAEWDDTKRVFHTKPAHTWASHYADAMRYLAAGEGYIGGWGRLDYSEVDRVAV